VKANLTASARSAIPIAAVTVATLPKWLKGATARERAWLATTGFRGEPGSFTKAAVVAPAPAR